MNYESVRMRQESIQEQKGKNTILDRTFALEDERDLFYHLLKDCLEYLPEIDPHGIDKRAVEEALRG